MLRVERDLRGAHQTIIDLHGKLTAAVTMLRSVAKQPYRDTNPWSLLESLRCEAQAVLDKVGA
jgi:hypothetical protein